ncbi:MAG: 2-phosphosulfolactate phosphatase [Candidatus Limnocylindria bacterium]
MRVRRTSLLAGAKGVSGHAVIVDVFRAFTTAAFCVAAGAREIVLVARPEDALAVRHRDPLVFLTGEIEGKPIAGFDAGNSPSAIEKLDLSGRRVVQRTSSGTQGVVLASRAADEVVLASFVIAGATARYLARRAEEVTLVAMGEGGVEPAAEDEACAGYLEDLLCGSRPDLASVLAALSRFEATEWPWWFPRRDAELALDADRFDFALPVVREGGLLVARPVAAAAEPR